MNLHHIIVFLSIIIISISIQNAFADNSQIPWKITIKSDHLKINDTSFWPQELQAREGSIIEWTNKDTISHTVTSGVPNHLEYMGKIFDSGMINPGKTYSFEIPSDKWSAYYYFCKIHPWITGKIDVGDAYLNQSPIFTINTDKETYQNNEIIKISGFVNNTYQIMPLTMQIFDSQRNLIFADKTNLLKDKSFSYQLTANNNIFKSTGNYKIKAFYGFPATVTDTNFSIVGNSTSTNLAAYHIPGWIKNNAGLWSTGQISDNDFIQGVEYLIKTGYIKVTDTSMIKTESSTIPTWVKSNAGLWAKSTISDQEFASGIQYLISQGIIEI